MQEQIAAALEAHPDLADILGGMFRMMQETGHGAVEIQVRDGVIQGWNINQKHRAKQRK